MAFISNVPHNSVASLRDEFIHNIQSETRKKIFPNMINCRKHTPTVEYLFKRYLPNYFRFKAVDYYGKGFLLEW